LKKSGSEKIALGKILGPWGLKGEVKFLLYNSNSEIIFKTRQIFFLAGFVFEEQELSNVRKQGRFLILRLKKFSTPEEAQTLKGQEVWVNQSSLPALEEGEYYFQDLIGFKIFDEAGKEFGELLSLANYGASDLLVVKHEGREVLIPYASGWVSEILKEEKRILVSKEVWDL